jgi:RimJ/RimL family protein N-acetyltransferase
MHSYSEHQTMSNDDLLQGNVIYLKPATLSDKRAVYEWSAQSDITKCIMDPPLFPDNPVPTWKEFNQDYKDNFFDGSQQLLGRGFLICTDCETVGFTNYNDIFLDEGFTELDVWLKSDEYCGKGYGTDAILTLCKYLKALYDLKYVLMEPSARNPRAVRSYQKIGFIDAKLSAVEAEAKYGPRDYHDGICMIKHL